MAATYESVRLAAKALCTTIRIYKFHKRRGDFIEFPDLERLNLRRIEAAKYAAKAENALLMYQIEEELYNQA